MVSLFHEEWEGIGPALIRESGDLPGNAELYSAQNRVNSGVAEPICPYLGRLPKERHPGTPRQ